MVPSFPLKQVKESRLKSTFCLDLLKTGVVSGPSAAAVPLGVDEIASFSVHAESFGEKHSAFLGLVLGVDLLILAQLVRAMCELTLLLVGTRPEFYVFFTELRFLLILLYGRFVGHRGNMVAGRGRILS